MGFKIACLILSSAFFAYGFPHGDEHYKEAEHGNHKTVDSEHTVPKDIIYGSRELGSDELGNFGSGPLDLKDLGAKTLKPIRFAPPRQLGLNSYEIFSPKHHISETSGPLRPNRFEPEEFGDRYYVSEGFGFEHVGLEELRTKRISLEYLYPEGFRTRYVYKHIGSKGLKAKHDGPAALRPEHIRTVEIITKYLGPEGFKFDHFDGAILGPRQFGFEQYEHGHFVRSGAVDVEQDNFTPAPKTESGTDNFERRHFDNSHFVPRIG